MFSPTCFGLHSGHLQGDVLIARIQMWFTVWRSCERASWYFFKTKPTRCTNFSNLFLKWNSIRFGQFLCPSSGVFSLHTQQWYVIQICWQLVSRSICSCSQAVSKPVWQTIAVCVQRKNPDDGQRNCPKRVEFHFKNKFDKLVHLVGFIVRKWLPVSTPLDSNCIILLKNYLNKT